MDTYKNTIKNDVMEILGNTDFGNASGGTGEIVDQSQKYVFR